MIQVDLRADMSVAFRAVDQVSGKMRARAVARALNRAATTVRAEARRSIRDRYQISAARVNRVQRSAKRQPGSSCAWLGGMPGISLVPVALSLRKSGTEARSPRV